MDLQKLRHQLTEFGLNPCEWSLEIKRRVGKAAWLEVHSATCDLRFEGWAQRDGWRSLSLCEF